MKLSNNQVKRYHNLQEKFSDHIAENKTLMRNWTAMYKKAKDFQKQVGNTEEAKKAFEIIDQEINKINDNNSEISLYIAQEIIAKPEKDKNIAGAIQESLTIAGATNIVKDYITEPLARTFIKPLPNHSMASQHSGGFLSHLSSCAKHAIHHPLITLAGLGASIVHSPVAIGILASTCLVAATGMTYKYFKDRADSPKHDLTELALSVHKDLFIEEPEQNTFPEEEYQINNQSNHFPSEEQSTDHNDPNSVNGFLDNFIKSNQGN